jgi:hypothetical protein
MSLRSRLDKLLKDHPPPRCGPPGTRGFRGIEEPPGSPCPVCGEPDCGKVIIVEEIVTSGQDGLLIEVNR